MGPTPDKSGLLETFGMPENSRRRRVRVVTDGVKNRRHARKKMLRVVIRVVSWAIVLLLGVIVFWWVLDKMIQPPPRE